MHSACAWFALAIAGVGWFYLFGSPSARRLDGIEAQLVLRRRIFLRSVNGGCLNVLATCLFAGVYSIEPADRPGLFVGDWIVVMLLLLISVGLAMVDIRLTGRLRRFIAGPHSPPGLPSPRREGRA